MRLLACVLLIAVSSAITLGQTVDEPKCGVQELAINAALGNTEAQFYLGVYFYRGDEVPQDFSKAAIMWRLASAAGIVEAANNLGFLTYYGKGVKRDYAEGLRLWRKAAELGFAESQVHLASAYSDGKYLPLNFIEAYAWAKTGKHYAASMKDVSLRAPVSKMAEDALGEARLKLSAAQLALAERKARLYISKYAPTM